MVKRFSQQYPGRMLFFSVIVTIVIGTLLLSLPFAQKESIPLIEIFFTATSATCVTGLLTISLDQFTHAGQFIIFLLMQIGGLGLATMTFIFLSFFKEMGLGTQWVAGQLLDLDHLKNIRKMFLFILLFTAIIELLGALITFSMIMYDYPLQQAIFYSLFHAVSSFCNAGLILFPSGMEVYKSNIGMLLTTSLLMLIGGFGFVAWYELASFARARWHKKKRGLLQLSLQSKITVTYTIILTFIATTLFFLLEYNNAFIDQSLLLKCCNAFFNGASIRSTGFLTVSANVLQLATILVIMIFSFIGASPGSTGSGIKTTVFSIFLATCRSVFAGRPAVEIRGRRIANTQVFKALTIITLSISWIILTTFFLLITEKSFSFLDILFETTSAFVTLGVSSGITPSLSIIGKFFLIISMIIGRIGSLTLALAFIRFHDAKEFSYPEERVMLS